MEGTQQQSKEIRDNRPLHQFHLPGKVHILVRFVHPQKMAVRVLVLFMKQILPPLRPLMPCCIAFAAIITIAPRADAIIIDFDQSYTIGALAGQPSAAGLTKWTDVNNRVQVAAGKGVGGTQAIYAAADSGYAVSWSNFSPTTADLGGGEDFNLASSTLTFSFTLAYDNLVAGMANVGRFYLGTSGAGQPGAVRIDWYSNGLIRYQNGSGTEISLQAATAGTLYTISGTVDYTQKTFALFVNGQQKGAGTFFTPSAAASAGFTVMSQNNNSANYTPWALDDMKIAVIPEPATLALLSLAGIAGIFWKSSRRKRMMQ